jgi:hypothetical protein
MLDINEVDCSNTDHMDGNFGGGGRITGRVNANTGRRRRYSNLVTERKGAGMSSNLKNASSQILKSDINKPIIKSNTSWQATVNEYTKTKAAATSAPVTPEEVVSPAAEYANDKSAIVAEPKKFLGMNQTVGVGLTVAVVLIGGYLIYKKFFDKVAVPVVAAAV